MLLHDPRVLVLDEATSALDSVSERKIQAALAELVSGRTTIAVAHRLSTIQSADVIHVVERGRIVESGTHEQLLATGTVYRALYDEQFGAGDVECECTDGVVWADGRFGPSDGADDVAARSFDPHPPPPSTRAHRRGRGAVSARPCSASHPMQHDTGWRSMELSRVRAPPKAWVDPRIRAAGCAYSRSASSRTRLAALLDVERGAPGHTRWGRTVASYARAAIRAAAGSQAGLAVPAHDGNPEHGW